jgi:hypothetical protein
MLAVWQHAEESNIDAWERLSGVSGSGFVLNICTPKQ